MSNKVWSDAELEFVRDNAGRMKDAALAAKLCEITGRLVSVYAVRQARQRLGIKKRRGRGLCEVVGVAHNHPEAAEGDKVTSSEGDGGDFEATPQTDGSAAHELTVRPTASQDEVSV